MITEEEMMKKHPWIKWAIYFEDDEELENSIDGIKELKKDTPKEIIKKYENWKKEYKKMMNNNIPIPEDF